MTDSTCTITQIATLTICNNCAVATNTDTVTAYITATTSAGNGAISEILSALAPGKTIPVQNHPVYYNSTEPFGNPSQYATGSGASERINPTSSSLRLPGAHGAPSMSGSGVPAIPASSSGSSFAQYSSVASGSGYQHVPFPSSVSGHPASSPGVLNSATLNSPFSTTRLSASGNAQRTYSLSGSGTFESSGHLISQSPIPIGTGSSRSLSSLSATPHASAPYPISASGSSSPLSSAGTAAPSTHPTGTENRKTAGASGYSGSAYQPSFSGYSAHQSGSTASLSPSYPSSGLVYYRPVLPSGTGSNPYTSGTVIPGSTSASGSGFNSVHPSYATGTSRSALPSGTASNSIYPFSSPIASGSQVSSGTSPHSTYPSSGGGFSRPYSLSDTASHSSYTASGTGPSRSVAPSGTGSSLFTPSASGFPRSSPPGTAPRYTSSSMTSTRPTQASGTGVSTFSSSGTTSKPYYPSSGTAHSRSSPSATGSEITYPFGSVSSTFSRPTGSGSISAYASGTFSGTAYSRPNSASSAYYPTGSSAGTASYYPTGSSSSGTASYYPTGPLSSGIAPYYPTRSSSSGTAPYYITGPSSSGTAPIVSAISISIPLGSVSPILSQPTSALPSSTAPDTSAVVASATSAMVPPATSACSVALESFQLKVSATSDDDSLGLDGTYLTVAPYSGTPDDATYYSSVDYSTTFRIIAGSLVTASDSEPDTEFANVDPSNQDYPTILRFDTTTTLASSPEAQRPFCRIADDTLSCSDGSGTDLTAYGCQGTQHILLSTAPPTTESGCYPLTLNTVFNDPCASSPVNSPSITPTPVLPSITAPVTSVLPSTTAPVTSAVVPPVTSARVAAAPLETFKLQLSGSGLANDGSYLQLEPEEDFPGDAAYPNAALDDAATFFTQAGVLSSNDGRSGSFELATVDTSPNGFGDLSLFASPQDLIIFVEQGDDGTEAVSCDTASGTLSCTAGGDPTLLVFYICPNNGGLIEVGTSMPSDSLGCGGNRWNSSQYIRQLWQSNSLCTFHHSAGDICNRGTSNICMCNCRTAGDIQSPGLCSWLCQSWLVLPSCAI